MGPRTNPLLLLVFALLAAVPCAAQTTPPAAPPASTSSAAQLPDAPQPLRPIPTPADREAERIRHLAVVNYRPYDKPTHKDQFIDYLNDSYGLPALGRSTVRALYGEVRANSTAWGTDFPGYMQRFGSDLASNAVSGNVRYGMETVFHEDMRYIPCHGCRPMHKIENALLAEITARHDTDGHRFFTMTPVVSDFSGPLIANTYWVPNGTPGGGVKAARTVAVVRVAAHLFQEFVLERRHHDPPEN